MANRLTEATRCPYCSQTYKDPRSLACGHSFCRACIADIVLKKTVTCPKCEKTSHVPQGDPGNLIKNLVLLGLIDSHHNLYSDPCLKCSECQVYERREAVEYCYSCQVSLCSLCSQSHVTHSHIIGDVARFETESMQLRDKTTQSLLSRTDAKQKQLDQRLQLVSTQEKRVKSASKRIASDVRDAFNQHLRKLTETRDEILEQTTEREDFLLRKLEMVADHTRNFVESFSKINSNLIVSKNKRLRGNALKNHIALCHGLETLLQDDIDVDILKETSAFAEGYAFKSNEPQTVGSVQKAGVGWRVRLDKAVTKKQSISCMSATPDGRVAIGYSIKNSGLSLFNPDGTEECPPSMQTVSIRGLAYLPDGRFTILDLHNKLSLYSTSYTELDFTFKTLSNDEGGPGRLCADEHYFIYVAYKKARKIQVFAPMGGAPLKEISFTGIEPIDVRVSPEGAIILISWRKVKLLDQTGVLRGEMTHTVSDQLVVADFCSDETLMIAFLAQEPGQDFLTLRRYSTDSSMTITETPFKNLPIAISPMPFYCIRELVTGEIALCTKDRLYLFQHHTGEVNDDGFAEVDPKT